MLRLDQRGVAPVIIVIVIVGATGAGVGTPVVIDVVDTKPDHPLYGLERLGEQIRMVGDEAQMKERWDEYTYLVDKGKGLGYRAIMEDFMAEMHAVAPGDVAAGREAVQWMQKQMPEIGLMQLKLWKEGLERYKAYLPELEEELEEDIEEIEEYIALPAFPPKVLDNIQAHLRLIRERIEKYRARIPAEVLGYLTIDDAFAEAHVKISVEVHITIKAPVDLAAEFREELVDFREELAEIRLALKIAPVELKVTLGLPAVQELVEAAEDYMVRAEAAFGRRELIKALALLYTAKAKLEQAESILEYAEYWEEEYQEIWEEYEQEVKDYMIEYAKREMLDAEIPENVALAILEKAIAADPTLEELSTIVAAMIDLHEAGASPKTMVGVFTLVEAKVAADIDRELLLWEFSTIVSALIDMLDAEIPENVALEILERAIAADPTLEELTTIVAAMIDLHEAGASPKTMVGVFTLVEAKVAAGIDRELLLEEFTTITGAKIDMLDAEIPENVALEILEKAIAADPTLEDLTTIVAAEIERFKAGVPPVPE